MMAGPTPIVEYLSWRIGAICPARSLAMLFSKFRPMRVKISPYEIFKDCFILCRKEWRQTIHSRSNGLRSKSRGLRCQVTVTPDGLASRYPEVGLETEVDVSPERFAPPGDSVRCARCRSQVFHKSGCQNQAYRRPSAVVTRLLQTSPE